MLLHHHANWKSSCSLIAWQPKNSMPSFAWQYDGTRLCACERKIWAKATPTHTKEAKWFFSKSTENDFGETITQNKNCPEDVPAVAPRSLDLPHVSNIKKHFSLCLWLYDDDNDDGGMRKRKIPLPQRVFNCGRALR